MRVLKPPKGENSGRRRKYKTRRVLDTTSMDNSMFFSPYTQAMWAQDQVVAST